MVQGVSYNSIKQKAGKKKQNKRKEQNSNAVDGYLTAVKALNAQKAEEQYAHAEKRAELCADSMETQHILRVAADEAENIAKEESINKNNNVNGNWQTNLEEYIRSNISSDKEVIKKVNAEFEKILIDESLKATNGIKLEAAKLLGWGRNTLARKAKNV